MEFILNYFPSGHFVLTIKWKNVHMLKIWKNISYIKLSKLIDNYHIKS